MGGSHHPPEGSSHCPEDGRTDCQTGKVCLCKEVCVLFGPSGWTGDQPTGKQDTEFVRPRTKKDLRAFLGLAGYYRRFVPDFSKVTACLSDLTSKKLPDALEWKEEHQRAFDEVKPLLVEKPTLTAPDPDKPYVLHTDASGRGLGAVLSQEMNGLDQPIAYFSRKLLDRETRYTVTELECLAIVEAVRHFSAYLLGASFQIVTDHGALKFLETLRNGGPRLTCWT